MFPTWPAKSEMSRGRSHGNSPKPPSGGKAYSKLVVSSGCPHSCEYVTNVMHRSVSKAPRIAGYAHGLHNQAPQAGREYWYKSGLFTCVTGRRWWAHGWLHARDGQECSCLRTWLCSQVLDVHHGQQCVHSKARKAKDGDSTSHWCVQTTCIQHLVWDFKQPHTVGVVLGPPAGHVFWWQDAEHREDTVLLHSQWSSHPLRYYSVWRTLYASHDSGETFDKDSFFGWIIVFPELFSASKNFELKLCLRLLFILTSAFV